MEIRGWFSGACLAVALSGCASLVPFGGGIDQVYVADFKSDAPASCRPSDVNLSHAQAAAFFRRAREVDYKTLHDHYELAPCYIMGTSKRHGESCDWKIRPGGTGSMRCGAHITYFACDTCADLFGDK